MAWDGWPLVSGTTKIYEFKIIKQLWDAIAERRWCLSGPSDVWPHTIWPRTNHVYEEGTISGLVDNEDGTFTITDVSKAEAPIGQPDDGRYWNGATRSHPAHESPYWVGFSDPDLPFIPTNWDVIIQHHNGAIEWYRDQSPWDCIRTNLQSSTSRTFTIQANLENYAVAGAIPSVSALVGKRYYFIGSGGMWWADHSFHFGRYPDVPNDQEDWRGKLSGTNDLGKLYPSGEGWIYEQTNKFYPSPYDSKFPPENTWEIDQWVAKEVLIYDADNSDLHRLVVTSNSEHTIYFGGMTAALRATVLVDIAGTTTALDGVERSFTLVEDTDELKRYEHGDSYFELILNETWNGELIDGGVPVAVFTALRVGGGFEFTVTTPGVTIEETALELHDFFSVVPPESKGWPGSKPWRTQWWYGGAQETVTTHDPSLDPILAPGPSYHLYPRGLAFAAVSKEWLELEPGAEGLVCGDPETIINAAALDVDLWSARVNECAEPDKNHSPHYHKSLRALQVIIEDWLDSDGDGGSWIRPIIDPDGEFEIPTYSTAQCFADADINWGTSSVVMEATTYGFGSGTLHTYYFTVADKYKGVSVFWQASVGGLRKGLDYSVADAVTGRVIVHQSDADTDDPTWLGASVVYSAGWTRWERLDFTHMYERIAFIPDVDSSGEGPSIVKYPPSVDDFEETQCFGTGQWVWRGNSSEYKIYDAYGYATESGGAYVAGKAARYVGDAWLDPGTGSTAGEGDDTADLIYWDRFYEGQHPKRVQDMMRELRFGTVLRSTSRSITFDLDEGVSFYNQWYAGSGVMRTESGTATAGTTTSITTTESLTDVLDPAHCWWATDRFSGSIFEVSSVVKPYVSFIIELDVDEEDPETEVVTTTTYKTVITNVTNNTPGNAPIIHFNPVQDEDGFDIAFADGTNWRIVEPATTLHRWRGRRVRYTRFDGVVVDVDITHNDDDTIFFDAQGLENIPSPGDVVNIIEHETGGVWKFQTTEPTTEQKATLAWQKIATNKYWLQPTGADVRVGNSSTWKTDMTENLAHLHPKKYGRMLKGDSIGIHLYDEVYKMINQLRWTKIGIAWTSRADDMVAEDNEIAGTSFTQPTGQPDMEGSGSSQEFASLAWNGTGIYDTWQTKGEADGPPPYLYVRQQALIGETPSEDEYWAEKAVRYAYGLAGGIPILISSATEFYAVAEPYFLPLGETVTTPNPAYGTGTLKTTFEYETGGHEDMGPVYMYSLFDSIGPARTDTRKSQKFGDGEEPEFGLDPDVPTVQGDNHTVSAGYLVTDGVVVLKWDVTDGLRYVD